MESAAEMPRRDDLTRKIMVIGSGPIVIGQACEFDYSGTQACKALRSEGYEVVAGELEPGHDHDRSRVRGPDLHRAAFAGVGAARSWNANGPTRCCPPSGARPRLNVAVALAESGDLDRLGIQPDRRVAGGDPAAPRTAAGSRRPWSKAGLDVPRAGVAHTLEEAMAARRVDRLPAHRAGLVHAGRRGSGFAANDEELADARGARARDLARSGRSWSRSRSRDGRSSSSRSCATAQDNGVIVCSIENVDPMGMHTGRLRSRWRPSRR